MLILLASSCAVTAAGCTALQDALVRASSSRLAGGGKNFPGSFLIRCLFQIPGDAECVPRPSAVTPVFTPRNFTVISFTCSPGFRFYRKFLHPFGGEDACILP